MLNAGLVSITYRNHTADEIIEEAVKSRLSGIEWGSDVHAKQTDEAEARRIAEKMAQANLKTYSYGSYYRAGENENPEEDFLPYLKCAKILNAPMIRVWAGKLGSDAADEEYKNKVISDTQIICDMAKSENMQISYEYHANTLTDNITSAMDTYNKVNRDNLKLYWQPNFKISLEENLYALKTVLPVLTNVHAFFWEFSGSTVLRRSLTEEEAVVYWSKIVDIVKGDNKEHSFLLEFVKDDSLQNLMTEAGALISLLGQQN